MVKVLKSTPDIDKGLYDTVCWPTNNVEMKQEIMWIITMYDCLHPRAIYLNPLRDYQIIDGTHLETGQVILSCVQKPPEGSNEAAWPSREMHATFFIHVSL